MDQHNFFILLDKIERAYSDHEDERMSYIRKELLKEFKNNRNAAIQMFCNYVATVFDADRYYLHYEAIFYHLNQNEIEGIAESLLEYHWGSQDYEFLNIYFIPILISNSANRNDRWIQLFEREIIRFQERFTDYAGQLNSYDKFVDFCGKILMGLNYNYLELNNIVNANTFSLWCEEDRETYSKYLHRVKEGYLRMVRSLIAGENNTQ